MKDMMLVHVDLYVSRMEKSLDFYVSKLGFTLREDSVVEGDLPLYLSGGLCNSMRLVILEASKIGAGIELMEFQQSLGAPQFTVYPMSGSISFRVREMQQIMDQLANVNVFPEVAPFFIDLPRIGKSKIVLYRDPDRHSIEFIQKIII